VNAYDYFARDAGKTAVVDGAPPIMPEETAPPPAPAPLRIWPGVALLWYIVHASVVGAAYIYLTLYPLEKTEYRNWQAFPIGAAAALLLWAITLTARRLARAMKEER
jgi:hypothetical protein